MNLSIYYTKAYNNETAFRRRKNKPNSNPIKPNCRKAKMNVNLTFTKDYRKKDDFIVRINKPNSNPISVKPKMSANAFSQKDYENKTAFRPRKNKPKQSQGIKRVRSFFRFIRLMRRWTKQRGEICASGAPNDFSRSSETPNTPTHFSEEPYLAVSFLQQECKIKTIFERVSYILQI
jgi:hypothetical protein